MRNLPRYITLKMTVLLSCVCVCRKHSVERQTSRFAINYYVRPDFEESYPVGSLEMSRLESQVEDEYISTLQHNCYRERSYRKSLRLSCFIIIIIIILPHHIALNLVHVKQTLFLGADLRCGVATCAVADEVADEALAVWSSEAAEENQ